MSALERLMRHVYMEPMSGCWLWTGAVTSNKGYAWMSYNGTQTNAHRVSWIEHRGPIPDGMHVLHRCDVRCCVNPDHLFIGTNYDNVLDKMKKGRAVTKNPARGERHWRAKLRNADITAIRDEYTTKRTSQYVLASRYGVTQTVISDIVRGKGWAHV